MPVCGEGSVSMKEGLRTCGCWILLATGRLWGDGTRLGGELEWCDAGAGAAEPSWREDCALGSRVMGSDV